MKTFALGMIFCAAAIAQEKPNVLFIFADDLTYEAIGAWNKEVKTPNIDRLVNSGTNFSHAYNMGSWSDAVCIGSRTMLNTGRTVFRANGMSTSASQSWAGIMNSAGYKTYYTGKWHVDKVDMTNFDVKGTKRGGMAGDNYRDGAEIGYVRPVEGKPDAWSPTATKFGGYWAGGTHWSEVVANETVGFINTAKAKSEPFFMYVAFNAPHDPRQAPQEYQDMYNLDSIAVPADFQPAYPDKEKLGVGDGLRDEHLAPFPRTHFAVKTHRKEYYAAISHMDAQIGKILDALEASGKQDNTYVIFSADHGLAIGHHGFMGKQNMYEHSLRAPFLMTGPDIPAKKTISAKIYIQDAMATAIDLAKVSKPDHVEFNSVMPLIKGTSTKLYDEIYSTLTSEQRMIIKGDYKLVFYPPLDKGLLFNLKQDPTEVDNLIASPSHAAIIDTLWNAFKAKEKELGRSASAIAAYDFTVPAKVGPQLPLVDNTPSAIGQAWMPPQFRNLPSHYEVYDLAGKLVERRSQGRGDVRWNGRLSTGEAAKPGVYLIKYGKQVFRQVVGHSGPDIL